MSELLFFDSLNSQCNPAAAPPRRALATWMLLLNDWFVEDEISATTFDAVNDFRSRMSRQLYVLADFDFLPLMLVRANEPEIQALTGERALRFAVPQIFEPSYCLPVLRGLNALRSQTGYQVYEWGPYVEADGKLPFAAFEGGLWPPQEYPVFQGAAVDKLVCPPAWLPVINLSMGTFLDDVVNPAYFATESVSRTHLVVLAAGNSRGSPVNSFAGTAGICVGATADEAGQRLADYSSRGADAPNARRPDVVAFGGSDAGEPPGTSFAAPRVSILGCLFAAVLLQLERQYRWNWGNVRGGVPLVGWGMIDHLRGFEYLPRRRQVDATPFIEFEPVVERSFSTLRELNCPLHLSLYPAHAKDTILASARPMPGYHAREVGAGFVSDEIFLDHLSQLPLKTILQPFLTEAAKSVLPAEWLDATFVRRGQLEMLLQFIRKSAPCWVYDYVSQKFCVNRNEGTPLSPDGSGHAHKVIAAAHHQSLHALYAR